ncbi:hypothetical protein RchiOBHm_Chr4g0400171 [Rosa chinensis]|uniref:Uncharacterized protein n=1 Tax=Rosa chinensis TaxID=74649 RepID=A0A2P6QSR3_ROSCH|nr:hypothetical protein RchiOBHm_Chr4g0400171 [Rosa chinensis]
MDGLETANRYSRSPERIPISVPAVRLKLQSEHWVQHAAMYALLDYYSSENCSWFLNRIWNQVILGIHVCSWNQLLSII